MSEEAPLSLWEPQESAQLTAGSPSPAASDLPIYDTSTTCSSRSPTSRAANEIGHAEQPKWVQAPSEHLCACAGLHQQALGMQSLCDSVLQGFLNQASAGLLAATLYA